MEFLCTPYDMAREAGLESEIKAISKGARDLIDIARLWLLEPKRSLMISRNPELPFDAVGISFEISSKSICIANVLTDEVKKQCERFQPLNPEISVFDDCEGCRPDEDWFDKRDTRLEVYGDWKYKRNRVSPKSSIELILSYALADIGYAKLKYKKRKKDLKMQILIDLFYCTPDEKYAWLEEFVIDPEERPSVN